jgi:hypothetical protein
MVAGRNRQPTRWRSLGLACALVAGCSSSSGGAFDGAPASDAPPGDAGADVRPDGHGGTVRGGSGGTSRDGGSGGAGGARDGGLTTDGPRGSGLAGDTCETAQALVLDRPRLEVTGSTAQARHDLDLACATGGKDGKDLFFSFTLDERELVYADTLGTPFNTILAFADGCTPVTTPALACLDDACGGKQSQVVALLPAGRHYLVVSGAGGESGDFTVHLEHAPAGAGSVERLPGGTASTSGITSGSGRLALCEAGGPENSYWWTSCADFKGGVFMATTCSNTAYDSLLALQIPRTAGVVCNDDACKLQAALTTNLPPGAGLHVLSVDGFTPRQQGKYTLITVRP